MIAKISTDHPLYLGMRRNYEVLQVVVDIKNIAVQHDILDFVSEHGPVSLSKESPVREVYFHSDKHKEDELVFFSLELKGNYIHLLPGNSDVDIVWIDDSYSVTSGTFVQKKAIA